MGRFFSNAALFNGEVPTRSAFDQVETQLTRELACNEVLAASVFGSVASGTHNARSDLDVFIVAKEGAGWRLHAHRLAGICAEAERSHVPLQLIVLDEAQAVAPGQGIGLGLYEHLCSQGAKQIVGTRAPTSFLIPSEDGLKKEAAVYRGHKCNRLQQNVHGWRGMAWSERLCALERAADGPLHLARKIVHAMTHTLPVDQKSVVEAFAEVADAYGAPEAVRTLTRIQDANREYASRVLAQPFKPHGHDRLLKEFGGVVGYETALERIWAKLAQDAWAFYHETAPFFA